MPKITHKIVPKLHLEISYNVPNIVPEIVLEIVSLQS